MKKQMTKNIKKAMILFWAVICILGIKGNVYAQDIKLVAPIITSSQMENGNFVIRWRTSEELKGQEYKIYCATSKDGTYEYVTTTPDYSYTEYYPNKGGTDLKRGGYSENSRETIRDDSVSPEKIGS